MLERPSLASAVPDSVTPEAVGLMMIEPFAETDDEPPVTVLMAESRSPRLSPIPMLVPVLVEPAVKVKVVPLTTSVSAVVRPVARSLDEVAAAPDSSVDVEIATGVVALVLTLEPVTGFESAANRLVADAPVSVAEVTLDLVSYPVGLCSTWLAIDCASATRLESEVRPVLAACRICTPLPIPSSRLAMSLARLFSDSAVKNSVGLSSAVLTLLPVARLFWVFASSEAVDCSASRFWRTDAESVIPDIVSNLPSLRYSLFLGRHA